MIEIFEYPQDGFIEYNLVRDINNLVIDSDIKERFDFGDFLFIYLKDKKLLGIQVFRLEKFDTEEKLPRFIHIILSPELRRKREAVIFLITAEKELFKKGYYKSWSYILKEKKEMQNLSKEFGYKEFDKDENGIIMVKDIGA